MHYQRSRSKREICRHSNNTVALYSKKKERTMATVIVEDHSIHRFCNDTIEKP